MLGMWGCDGDCETPLCTTPWLSTIIPVPMHPAGLQSTAKPPPALLLACFFLALLLQAQLHSLFPAAS